MKKFTIKLLIFSIFVLAVIVPYNVYVDPYNVFHWENVRDNGVEPNKNFIKTKYVLKHKDEYDTFVFGSSRAGFLDLEYHENFGRWYDMCSSEAVPGEHLRILKKLIDGGVDVKNVIIYTDDISCMVDPKLHKDVQYRVPYPDNNPIALGTFYFRYFDLITTIKSYEVTGSYVPNDPEFAERFHTTGHDRCDIPGGLFDGVDTEPFCPDYFKNRVPEALDDMRAIKELCDENGINLYVATNPIYHTALAKEIENGYLDYLYGLAEITPYVNFSSFSDITQDNYYYYETSHFIPYVGDRMMDEILYEDGDDNLRAQGFGMRVDMSNRDELIGLIEKQYEEYKKTH